MQAGSGTSDTLRRYIPNRPSLPRPFNAGRLTLNAADFASLAADYRVMRYALNSNPSEKVRMMHVLLILLCLFRAPVILAVAENNVARSKRIERARQTIVQTADDATPVMPHGNPQRSGVLFTRGLDQPPRETLWKSIKLFQYREFNTTVATSGPIRLWLDIPTSQTFSVPIISKDTIFFVFNTENAYLYAIDASTGKELVVLKFEKNFLSAPAAIANTVFFGDRSGAHAFDLSTRVEKWLYERKGLWFSYAEPVIEGETIYMFGGGTGQGLYAFATDTGDLKWTFASSQFLYGPAISDNQLILVNPKGSLLALDKTSGKKRWEVRIDGDSYEPGILDDQVFLSSKNGEIRSYALQNGSLKWKAKRRGGAFTELVLFNGKVIFSGRDDSILALDALTGIDAWTFKTNSRCRAPIVAGNLVYAACEDHRLYAIDPSTGLEKWRVDNKKTTPPRPMFRSGVMYTLGTDGILWAMK